MWRVMKNDKSGKRWVAVDEANWAAARYLHLNVHKLNTVQAGGISAKEIGVTPRAPHTLLHLNIRVHVIVGGDVVGVEVVGHDGYDRLDAEAGVGYGGVWWGMVSGKAVWANRK